MKRLSALLLTVASTTAIAQTKVERSFDGIKEIEISVSSANATFERSSDQTVSLELIHDVKDYEPIIEQRGSRLIIEEEERRGSWSYRGSIDWNFKIPDGLEIRFNTGSGNAEMTGLAVEEVKINSGSGDFDFEEVSGEFKLNTGSGDFRLEKAEGEVSINTGSGSIRIDESKLRISANTGSGDVTARGVTIIGSSTFNSGSGDAEVSLNGALDHDISINSGSGDATLDFNGSPIEGEIVMEVQKRRGKIEAPFEFDEVEEIDRGGRDNVVIRKSVKLGDKDVSIRINSGSGTAEIKE